MLYLEIRDTFLYFFFPVCQTTLLFFFFFLSAFERQAALPRFQHLNLVFLFFVFFILPPILLSLHPLSPKCCEGNPKVMLIGWDTVEIATVIS